MYSTVLGRYPQPDTNGYLGGANLYAYVNNDPLNQIDPLGLWQVTISGGLEIGGAVTFGYNSGQWNVGAWGGVGVGFAVRVNLSDAGLQTSGFQPSLRTGYNVNIGSLGGYGVGRQIRTRLTWWITHRHSLLLLLDSDTRNERHIVH